MPRNVPETRPAPVPTRPPPRGARVFRRLPRFNERIIYRVAVVGFVRRVRVYVYMLPIRTRLFIFARRTVI